MAEYFFAQKPDVSFGLQKLTGQKVKNSVYSYCLNLNTETISLSVVA